jgi:transcriptional regulator with XRE-family HTH domain
MGALDERGMRLIHAIRQRRLHKMAGLAQDLGVDESAISRWKAGGPMSLEKAARICRVLDISMDWLILGRGEMESHIAASSNGSEPGLISEFKTLPPEASRAAARLLSRIVNRLDRADDDVRT